MSYKTAMARAIGLGSAHHGGAHWFSERLIAVAMIPLSIWAVWIMSCLIGQPYDVAIAHLGKPINALVLIAFWGLCAKHLADGLQTVIQDYVHSAGWLVFLLITNKLGSWALGLIGIFSIAKIAFGGA